MTPKNVVTQIYENEKVQLEIEIAKHTYTDGAMRRRSSYRDLANATIKDSDTNTAFVILAVKTTGRQHEPVAPTKN